MEYLLCQQPQILAASVITYILYFTKFSMSKNPLDVLKSGLTKFENLTKKKMTFLLNIVIKHLLVIRL